MKVVRASVCLHFFVAYHSYHRNLSATAATMADMGREDTSERAELGFPVDVGVGVDTGTVSIGFLRNPEGTLLPVV